MPQFFGREALPDVARDALEAAHRAVVGAPDLRTLEAALRWMAGELVARFGFGRVMVLRPDDGLLSIVETVFSEEPELAREAQDNAERHPVELRTDGFEIEMMRRRSAALVVPGDDRRAWRPITDQLRTPAYVAAPVEAFGRTAATLHADTLYAGREVESRDRVAIGTFAAVCRGVVERALLFEEIDRLRAGARASAEQLLALAGPEHAADDRGAVASRSVLPPGPSRSPLTPREDEVLALMSRGATSQEIARRLVVSVGTVKTHARSILRKLGASTRAEAVARAIELRHEPPR